MTSKSDFLGLDGVAHLASGGQSPVLARLLEALEAERVLVTGELGRVRASVGLFTDAADLDAVERAMRAAMA